MTVNGKTLGMLTGVVLTSVLSIYLAAYKTGNLPYQYLFPIKLIVPDSYHQYVATRLFTDSNQWLLSARKVGQSNAHVSFRLWEELKERRETEAKYWLEKAAFLGSVKAKLVKAKQYYEINQNEKAIQLLTGVDSASAQKLKLRIAMKLGDIPYLNNEQHYSQLPPKDKLSFTQFLNGRSEHPQCTFPLSAFASEYEHLLKWQAFDRTLQSHPMGQYYCMVEIKYIAPQKHHCEMSADKPITCEEQMWADVDIEKSSYYLALMLSAGGANAHQGILYLDSHDSFEVFIHELTHFAGFVDEYTLADGHQVCVSEQTEPFSHNIAILNSVYIGERDLVINQLLAQIPWRDYLTEDAFNLVELESNKWAVEYSQGDGVGLHKSETCSNTKLRAFKPIQTMTNLRYNALPMPALYFEFLKRDPFRFSMPNYRTNIAKAFANQENAEQYYIWLQEALNYKVTR